MDHEDTREQLELAAAEPGGLDRLMAGDTATAQIVAAHLAGCLECADDLARLERTARLIREVVSELPPADLRERTLAMVRATGVSRGEAVAPPPPASIASASAGGARGGRVPLGWVAAIAAAVVISVVATGVYLDSRVSDRLASQTQTIEALEDVAAATLNVTAQPDVRRVTLSATDPAVAGNLVFSPSTTELVVVARGLTPPAAGLEYRCWVEEADGREGVGKMFFSDGLGYWIGPVPAVQGLVGDATFGVSLVSIDGTQDRQDVLVGGL